MKRLWKIALVIAVAFPTLGAGGSQPVERGMTRVGGGTFKPLYATPGQPIARVASFAIDTVPVSQQQFARFAVKHPEWKTAGSASDARRPATNVTWLAANAYCAARGARLPTTQEWEYVAAASETKRDASRDPSFRQRVLELAIHAAGSAFHIGNGFRNIWGVRDMHGGVAEWTADFNSSAHTHNSGHHMPTMTCATGTVETGDAGDYAAFMRYSLRRTLEVNSSMANLGFRCAL